MVSEVEKLEAGKNVDSWCTKCKMLLAHTIIAMVGVKPAKVECNTCKAVHAYKAKAPGATKEKKAGKTAGKARSTKKDPQEKWNSMVEERIGRGEEPVVYNIKEALTKGNLVKHPKFGMGVVLGNLDNLKVEVQFSDDVRVMVCGRN